MTDTTTRCPLLHVHESEILDWWNCGWHFVQPSERKDYLIIEWQLDKAPVMPFKEQPNEA